MRSTGVNPSDEKGEDGLIKSGLGTALVSLFHSFFFPKQDFAIITFTDGACWLLYYMH